MSNSTDNQQGMPERIKTEDLDKYESDRDADRSFEMLGIVLIAVLFAVAIIAAGAWIYR